jgi:molybdate transport system substrate-binding protein
MKKNLLLFIIVTILLLSSCSSRNEKSEEQMLFYVGITIVKPIAELAKSFMEENNCEIEIIQGGSQDLYDSLKLSNKGDLYLPGSLSYREAYKSEGILLDAKIVGYNQAAIQVKKGNPLNITSDLSKLEDENLKVILCNPDSGSIGDETKKILESYGNYDEAINNALFLTTDSRNIIKAFSEDNADISINWHATLTWEENKYIVESIPIDEKYAQRKILAINLLKSSDNPELAMKFIEYATSDIGRETFKKYGFLSDEDLDGIDKLVIE